MARPAAKPTRRTSTDPATARLLVVVDSESRPYTDPRASYDRARDAQRARTEGAFRRGRR
ncbi:hypothetical protein ACFQFC_35160 [Amorphoplanes digitatis]|uniref:Uncharacterized protein n=1 Tax=Actinoplanes digitatis TaxID=1868 RepID=A0A7W7MPI7_9ACTN|nr:hypothetical protein [Actinoplanes digitatis]MBB4761404.1 hypothetical protein [Actinoplanes digitatis]BFE69827.1 hypothetical protein GCM10020092_031280 [Actinoplanes digitatis]GID94550.1 hypothetical protein Adi01nite_39620 [Actinoplanes digitatis]